MCSSAFCVTCLWDRSELGLKVAGNAHFYFCLLRTHFDWGRARLRDRFCTRFGVFLRGKVVFAVRSRVVAASYGHLVRQFLSGCKPISTHTHTVSSEVATFD
jgi:hypothetical protein